MEKLFASVITWRTNIHDESDVARIEDALKSRWLAWLDEWIDCNYSQSLHHRWH